MEGCLWINKTIEKAYLSESYLSELAVTFGPVTAVTANATKTASSRGHSLRPRPARGVRGEGGCGRERAPRALPPLPAACDTPGRGQCGHVQLLRLPLIRPVGS